MYPTARPDWERLYERREDRLMGVAPMDGLILTAGADVRKDRIRLKWCLPRDDKRTESRRIDRDSLMIAGELKPLERERFFANSIVTSLDKERRESRGIAIQCRGSARLLVNTLDILIGKERHGF